MSDVKEKKSTQGAGMMLLDMLKHVLFHNGGLKLLAVLIAVILWAGLISQDATLTREKTFQDVNVNITGTDTMKRNGYIVTSDLNTLLDEVSVDVHLADVVHDDSEADAPTVRQDAVQQGRLATAQITCE